MKKIVCIVLSMLMTVSSVSVVLAEERNSFFDEVLLEEALEGTDDTFDIEKTDIENVDVEEADIEKADIENVDAENADTEKNDIEINDVEESVLISQMADEIENEIVEDTFDCENVACDEVINEAFGENPEEKADSLESNSASSVVKSGSCGPNATYTVEGNKTNGYTLTISGFGKMDDCSNLYSNYSANIVKVVISNRITTIGKHAFEGCVKLTSIEIPEAVTELGYAAFKDCKKLSSIKLGSKISKINGNAFQYCESLKSFEVPSKVTRIEANVFGGCENLQSITIPNSVTTIGEWAFAECKSLTEIKLPKNLKALKDYAFKNCTGLKSMNIPLGVGFDDGKLPTGSNQLFYGCTSLESVTIGANFFHWYNSSMFEGCTKLKTVNILYVKGYKEGNINTSTFAGCSSLKTINIPADCFNKINTNAFKGCTNLTSITIPKSVMEISSSAFSNCPNLTIRCFEGTKAHDYAVSNGFRYEVLPNGAYNICFDKNGAPSGSTEAMLNCKLGKGVKLIENGFSKQGYVFDCWNTMPDGTGKKYKNKATVKNIAKEGETLTLYAIWKPIKYTINFKGNKSTSGKMSTLKCNYDSSYTFKANAFKKKGYSFVNWNTQIDGTGKSYINQAVVQNLTINNNEKIYLYAQWRPNTYSLEFNGNGAEYGSTMKQQGCKYGTEYNLNANGFRKTGYTFASWNTKINGKGKKYKNQATVKNMTDKDAENIVLYAIWTPIKYNIAFNDNGASEKGKTVIQKNVTYDKNVKLKSNGFKRKGYRFVCWNTRADGRGISYDNKQSVSNLCSENGETLTLYAIWEKSN